MKKLQIFILLAIPMLIRSAIGCEFGTLFEKIKGDTITAELFTSQKDTVTYMLSNTGADTLKFEIFTSADTIFDIVPLSLANVWTYFKEIVQEDSLSRIVTDSILNIINYNGVECYKVQEDIENIAKGKKSENGKNREYVTTKTWRLDEFGNFWEGYSEGISDFDELLMVGEGKIGAIWDSVGLNDYTIITDRVDIETQRSTYFDCWKVEQLHPQGSKAVRYFQEGVGLVKYEWYNEIGNIVQSKLLIDNSNDPKWLMALDKNIVIYPGSTYKMKTIFDAANMYSGKYSGYINFRLNDSSANCCLRLKACLNVTGVPIISCANSFDFGDVFIGKFKKNKIVIKNTGTEDLIIDSLVFFDTIFKVNSSGLIIPPMLEQDIELSFYPKTQGVHIDSLKIYSNAFNSHVFCVIIKGTGLYPPEIEVSPAEIKVQLNEGEQANKTVTIENKGLNTLNYHILCGDTITINSFMPLQVGNKWLYIRHNEYVNLYPEINEIIGDTVINNIRYFIYNSIKPENYKSFDLRAYRTDDSGNIYDANITQLFNGEDTIFENRIMVGHPYVGKTWLPNNNAYDSYKIIAQTDVETPFGLIENCWVVEYYYVLPQGHHQYFNFFWKKGLGLVKQITIDTTNFGYPAYNYDTLFLNNCKINGPNWVSSNDSAGTILAGEQKQVSINIDASFIESKNSEAIIKIFSNDPFNSEVLIPIYVQKIGLSVTSKPYNGLIIYPNPAATSATIMLNTDEPGQITINAYDVFGRLTEKIFEGYALPGTNTFFWNTAAIKNNICIIRVEGMQLPKTLLIQISK